MRVRDDLVRPVLGRYGSDIVIVDDFYQDPDAIRRRALELEYSGPGSRYPGFESVQALASDALLDQFSALAGTPLQRGDDSVAFGKFRVGVDSGSVAVHVHLDHVDWSAIVYLSPDVAPGNGLGLSVYRHRELGLDRLDLPADLERFGCRTRAEFDKKYVRPATADPSAWETTFRIDYAYNRLLLLRSGSLFHGIAGLFGSDVASGRMTHSFFMNQGPR